MLPCSTDDDSKILGSARRFSLGTSVKKRSCTYLWYIMDKAEYKPTSCIQRWCSDNVADDVTRETVSERRQHVML